MKRDGSKGLTFDWRVHPLLNRHFYCLDLINFPMWPLNASKQHSCLIPPHPPPTELWTHVFPMGVIQIQSGLCAAQKPVQQKITLFVEPARLNNLTGPAFFYWPHSISHSFSWRLYVQNVWAITLTVSSAPSPPPSGAKYWLLSRFTHFYSNHRCQ